MSKKTTPEEFSDHSSISWKEHSDFKSKIESDIARLQQAGDDRDRRINAIEKSIDDMGKQLDSVKSTINRFTGAVIVVGFLITSIIGIFGYKIIEALSTR